MNDTKSKYKSINNFLMQEYSILAHELNAVTDTLKQMADTGLIESFGYSRNTDDYNAGFGKRIRIDVMFNQGKTILGVLDNIKQHYDSPPNMGQDVNKKLAEINQYLLFVNQHLKEHVPEITVNTYYSKKAANNEAGFKDVEAIGLYPDFVNKKIRANKPF